MTEVQQPLRIYWEYLSYLFQKVPALSAEEDLEKGYRDFLQVSTSEPNFDSMQIIWKPLVMKVDLRFEV